MPARDGADEETPADRGGPAEPEQRRRQQEGGEDVKPVEPDELLVAGEVRNGRPQRVYVFG